MKKIFTLILCAAGLLQAAQEIENGTRITVCQIVPHLLSKKLEENMFKGNQRSANLVEQETILEIAKLLEARKKAEFEAFVPQHDPKNYDVKDYGQYVSLPLTSNDGLTGTLLKNAVMLSLGYEMGQGRQGVVQGRLFTLKNRRFIPVTGEAISDEVWVKIRPGQDEPENRLYLATSK